MDFILLKVHNSCLYQQDIYNIEINNKIVAWIVGKAAESTNITNDKRPSTQITVSHMNINQI